MTVGELIDILNEFDKDDPNTSKVLRYCGITRNVVDVEGCAELDTNKWMAMLLTAE